MAGYRWTVVRKRGTFTVTNRRAERIDLRLRLSTGGRVEETSDGGVSEDRRRPPEDWPGSNTRAPA